MPRVPTSLLPVLAVALWPVQGQAQEGPSFNCRYAQTETELAICTNPQLAMLEMQMYGSYLRLVDALGERRARRIADRFLERRQACGSDEVCIARRLEITLRVFERRASGDTRLAAREPSEEELEGLDAAPSAEVAAAEPAPAIEEPAPTLAEVIAALEPPVRPAPPAAELAEPEEQLAALEPPALAPLAEEEAAIEPEPLPEEQLAAVQPPALAPRPEAEAAAEPPAAEPDLPLAAQAPLPPDLDPLLEEEAGEAPDLAAAEPPPSPEAIDEAIEGAELASSEESAPFDLPISWAFMHLIRPERAAIQARLQAGGFYEGPALGSWDNATLSAIEAFLASEEGSGFDVSTQSGAALALDFIRSDAFAEAHGISTPAAGEPAPADPGDPLGSTDW